MSGEKKPEPKEITVTMNNPEANKEFPDNYIKTSKYTIITFLPLNLFHQFRKVSNFYFLVNMIFALVPGVSPVNPASAVLPLIFVVGVALVKDGYEDYLRHVADDKANSIIAQVMRKKKDGAEGEYELVEVESADVRVGDVMYIVNGDEVRADVLLFASSGVEASVFIETCNLDGETNLKNRKGVEATWELNSVEEVLKHEVTVRTGEPDPRLLEWTGVLYVDGHETSVGLDQFLYRSCVMKNTEWAWGMVLYAGVDTKMFRNLQEKPPKSSGLDHKLNVLIVVVLIFQQIILIVSAGIAVAFNNNNQKHWYMKTYLDEQKGFSLWGYRYLTYFILMSYMIPISLFVTIELCKVAQALLMRWDHSMIEWMNEKWVTCVPNTSNLNEQLSQVKFIFSDKTGTLTENVMTYKLGNIRGLPVDSDDWDLSIGYLEGSDEAARAKADKYFRALALCHTINPFPDPHDDSKTIFDGASPDEIALVRTAKEHGYELVERYNRYMIVNIKGKRTRFDILATLEFTPDRKMMSIITREEGTGIIQMFTKGADSFVELHMSDDNPDLPETKVVLKDMAGLGLRTLMVCERQLTQEQFDDWHVKFTEAGKALVNRSKIVDEACLMAENDMKLVGVTAIEDKLQDEVPETLDFFLGAGVVVWMLTGDKRETAVTIAATSSLANAQRDHMVHIDVGDRKSDDPENVDIVRRQLEEVEKMCDIGDGKNVVFVIDGVAMHVAVGDELKTKFIEVSQRVNAAVCCRLTPLQKASVVNMFQTLTGKTALAIGDGANDVSMIQEGRVGVGIVGLEGAQAALAADYAIPRFRHLRRLCAVHGRYALARNALCVNFSFYKNFVMALVGFYFSFYTGFSGTTLYDGWLLTFFNVAFTAIPPLILGMFEKDLDERKLMNSPSAYPQCADGLYFDVPTLLRWFGEGLVHSLAAFFVIFPTLSRLDINGNQSMDYLMVGTINITGVILMALLKVSLHIRYWNGIQAFAIAISLFFFFGFVVIYSAIPNLFGETMFYFSYFILLGEPKLYLYALLMVVGFLCPIDQAIMYAQRLVLPTLVDRLQTEHIESGVGPDFDIEGLPTKKHHHHHHAAFDEEEEKKKGDNSDSDSDTRKHSSPKMDN